ncbi:MAG: GNAT family N-acetyltransferase [Hyphomicrobiaceae bacterium]
MTRGVVVVRSRRRKQKASAVATAKHPEMEFAIEVFVRGHSTGKSRTFPYEANRVGPLWVMRDAPRKNPRDYRKEEWIAHDVDVAEVDAIARRHTRGRFFVCAMVGEGEPDEPTRSAYKTLGYRLLATEGFFVQQLMRIPKQPRPVPIERVWTSEVAARLGKVTRTRPIPDSLLGDDAPFRQYVALDGEEIVGRVRSVDAIGATWCADMYVNPSHRRSGHRAGAIVQDVARRPGPRLEVFGADGKSHRRALVPARGLRAYRNALHVRAQEDKERIERRGDGLTQVRFSTRCRQPRAGW